MNTDARSLAILRRAIANEIAVSESELDGGDEPEVREAAGHLERLISGEDTIARLQEYVGELRAALEPFIKPGLRLQPHDQMVRRAREVWEKGECPKC